MKLNKTYAAAIAVLLVAGIAAVVLRNQDADPGAAANSGSGGTAAAGGDATGSAAPASGTARPSAARSRERQAAANAELVAKYGEARTSLSKHVSTNLIGIMEDAVQMGEMMLSAQGGGFGGGLGMALGRLNGELQLTEEQRNKAAALVKEYQARQNEKSKAAVERLKTDPTSLMQLMLASDASARGDMTDEEYRSVQTEAGQALAGIINPLDRSNFGGGSPLRDPEFVGGLKGILDPTQAEKFDAAMAQRQTEAGASPNYVPGVEEGNIAGLPKMELERLDKSIESARKVTTGIKSMMDGMGGLRDIIPPQPQEGQ
jgi:hypothetical protein